MDMSESPSSAVDLLHVVKPGSLLPEFLRRSKLGQLNDVEVGESKRIPIHDLVKPSARSLEANGGSMN